MAHVAIAGGTPLRQTPFPRWPVWDRGEIEAVKAVVERGCWGAGSVSKMEMAILHRPSKGISIHKQVDHDVVHLRRFREADGLANQAFDACPKRQVFALDFLRGAFAGGVRFRVKMTRVRPLLIGIVVGEAQGFQECFACEEHLIFAAPKDIR